MGAHCWRDPKLLLGRPPGATVLDRNTRERLSTKDTPAGGKSTRDWPVVSAWDMPGRAQVTQSRAGAVWLPSEGSVDLVTADDSGGLCAWRSGEEFQLVSKVPASGCPCSSVRLWNGVIVAGYGSGQIRLYEAASSTLRAEVAAHARWIYALDVAPLSGKLLSGAEDSFVAVWGLTCNPDTEGIEIRHCQTECVLDTQICGARFCDPEGRTFAVTGYDLSEIIRYVQL